MQTVTSSTVVTSGVSGVDVVIFVRVVVVGCVVVVVLVVVGIVVLAIVVVVVFETVVVGTVVVVVTGVVDFIIGAKAGSLVTSNKLTIGLIPRLSSS